MKKPFFRIGSFICICLLISMVYAQPNRRGMRRRFGLPPADQLKALEAMQQDLSKLKVILQEQIQTGDLSRDRQNQSRQDRDRLRQQWLKQRAVQRQLLLSLEKQVAAVKGIQDLQSEHEQTISHLEAIQALYS